MTQEEPQEFEGDLAGAVFWGADLRGARFRDVDLTGARITHAWFVDVDIDAKTASTASKDSPSSRKAASSTSCRRARPA